MPLELINNILLFSDIRTMINTYCSTRNLCDHLFWLTKFEEFYILNYDLSSKLFIEWVKLYRTIQKAQNEAKNMLKIVCASNITLDVHYQDQFNRFFPLEIQTRHKLDQCDFTQKKSFYIKYDYEWLIDIYFVQNNTYYSQRFSTGQNNSMILSLISEVILHHKTYNYTITDKHGTIILYEKLLEETESRYLLAYQVLNLK